MQNVNLDRGALARLGVEFEALLRELPEERKRMYERVGAAVLVRESVPGKRAYAQTMREAEEIACGAMETFVRQMEQKLEG